MDSAGVPIPWDDQIVSFYHLVRIQKAKNEPHLPVLNLKVKPKGFTILKTIDEVDVVLDKLQSKPLIKGVYTTNDPKYVRSTLVSTNLKVA